MPELGRVRLGTEKLGGGAAPTEAEIEAVSGPRQRAEDLIKDVFPTGEGTVWDQMLSTLVDELETMEAVRDAIYDARFIDTATGAELDKMATLWQLERRQNESDAHFRKRIKIQLPKYTSQTTIDDILRISTILLECGPENITLIESFDLEPARFDIQVDEHVLAQADIAVPEYVELLRAIKAAGVRVMATIGKLFTHRSEYEFQNAINDPARAYASEDGSVPGAPYADLITRQFD